MLYRQIGIRIRQHRIRMGLTQEKLAEMAGISLSFLGHIERGTRKLSVDTLHSLIAALDCSADELLGTGYAQRRDRASALELLKLARLLAEMEE